MTNPTICYNCEHEFDPSIYRICPRCGWPEHVETEGKTLFPVADPSPVIYRELLNRQTDLRVAREAERKYRALLKLGIYPELIFIRSYVLNQRGWRIEFKHRTLDAHEYLLAPASLKLVKSQLYK